MEIKIYVKKSDSEGRDIYADLNLISVGLYLAIASREI
jgi:hypothetical protein